MKECWLEYSDGVVLGVRDELTARFHICRKFSIAGLRHLLTVKHPRTNIASWTCGDEYSWRNLTAKVFEWRALIREPL